MIKYKSYLNSPAWKKKSEARLEQDGYVCQVCGQRATVVHHLSYDRIPYEAKSDLVCLCGGCHRKAEEISAMKKPGSDMASMIEDASIVAREVLEYIGTDFDSLMKLRQSGGREPYLRVGTVVRALCGNRYSRPDGADIDMVTNNVCAVCLARIEQDVRNGVQSALFKAVSDEYEHRRTLHETCSALKTDVKTVRAIMKNNGTDTGPSLRTLVLYYCAQDALYGIEPKRTYECLTGKDYKVLNKIAEYIRRNK